MTAATYLKPGTRYLDYEVVRPVGEGAMGVVYEVRKGPETYALKILKAGKAKSPEMIRDFANEAVATGSVRHEGVVDVVDHGEAAGLHYIVMEFVDGFTLEALLRKKEKLGWKVAVRITRQVAAALGHAHRMGLVHRDVKPGNILLYKDGRARLTDFGIVKDISSLKGFLLNGKQVGTSLYASPEQCLGKRLSQATDMYSLGATLYQMVCGRPVFTGKSRNDILGKHVHAKPVPPKDVVPTVPRALSNAIEKMLSKKQTDRYESMERLVEDLDLILDGKVPIANGKPKVNLAALKSVRLTKTGWRRKAK